LDARELLDAGAEGGVGGELRGGRDPGGGFLPGQADQVLVGEQPEQAQDRCVTGACGPVTQRVFRTLRNRTRRSSAT